MGLFDKIKSLLGLKKSSDRERQETTVTVERDVERQEGVDTSSAGEADEPIAAETSAAASTESLIDEAATGAEAAEPAEAAGPESEDIETDVASVDIEDAEAEGIDPESEAEEETEEPSAEESASVEVIKGIGPAYADRLDSAGIRSVADLREADVAAVAEQTDLSEKRISRWVERAMEYEG